MPRITSATGRPARWPAPGLKPSWGAAISVMTEEFFEDTGATDAESALAYGLNTEISGNNGNFADVNLSRGVSDTTAARREPHKANRVRGLAEATLTRGQFLTDIPFDGYNTSMVTVNRGPNSLLFGIGSPGGVIDSGLKMASLGRDFGEISIRLGERGSHRETIDYKSPTGRSAGSANRCHE